MTKPVVYPSFLTIKKWAYQKPASLASRRSGTAGGSKLDSTPAWSEAITTLDNADLLLTIASDRRCPQRAYILKCLYSLVGTSASKHVGADLQKIHELLARVHSSSDQVILNWVSRSRIILGDLRKFDYVEWCQGGFVERDLPSLQ